MSTTNRGRNGFNCLLCCMLSNSTLKGSRTVPSAKSPGSTSLHSAHRAGGRHSHGVVQSLSGPRRRQSVVKQSGEVAVSAHTTSHILSACTTSEN